MKCVRIHRHALPRMNAREMYYPGLNLEQKLHLVSCGAGETLVKFILLAAPPPSNFFFEISRKRYFRPRRYSSNE